MRPDGREHRIPVLPARLSPRSALQDHLAVILLMSLLYRLIPIVAVRRAITRHSPWIQAVADASLVGDIRGGDSFSDIYGMQRFLIGSLMALSVILVKGKLVQFPQTFGPFKRRTARMIARFILRRSTTVIARDRESQQVAQSLVGNHRRVLVCPDVAFSLRPIPPGQLRFKPAQIAGNDPAGVIGINVNGLMYHGGYTRSNMFGLRMDYPSFLTELVNELAARTSSEIWLVPHTFAKPGNVESDPEACEKVRTSLSSDFANRVRIVTGDYDCHEIKHVIGRTDFFIGSRMHSCIAALSQGIPCVGVAYSMKFRGVFESVGVPEWVIDGREFDNEQAVTRIMELYAQREKARGPLAARANAARASLAEAFGELFASASQSSV